MPELVSDREARDALARVLEGLYKGKKPAEGDYGGINDGTCEFSFFTRCTEASVAVVRFGQQGGWIYAYCAEHRDDCLAQHKDALVVYSL